MNLIAKTKNGFGHTGHCGYFSPLITAHSALFTSYSPLFPRNFFSPPSGPGLKTVPFSTDPVHSRGPILLCSRSRFASLQVMTLSRFIRSAIFLLAGSVPLPSAHATVVHAAFSLPPSTPVTAPGYTATGKTIEFALDFVPPTGTSLTVIENTNLSFIDGRFDNLEQGQRVALDYQGVNYQFIADYFGGTGNDLVLQWAIREAWAWGDNRSGELGIGFLASSAIPVPVYRTGALAGKTVLQVVAGRSHSVARCADGTLVAWGWNGLGQLGNGSTINSSMPVPVDPTGALAGKTVIALAAGSLHTLALCSDGSLVTWGNNILLPKVVAMEGALTGKAVVAMAAGYRFNVVLCSDGTIAAWGDGLSGQLGNGSFGNSGLPVAVDQTGVLAGKSVVAVFAGLNNGFALCSDGTVSAWGGNLVGQLGVGTFGPSSNVPLRIGESGVLAGKTIVSFSAGEGHSLAHCSDGTLAAWGYNEHGQLGDGSVNSANAPVLVSRSGALAGKTVGSVVAGGYFSFALCVDGTLAAWGRNDQGQLADGTTNDRSVPGVVNSAGPLGTGTLTDLSPGTRHNIAMKSSESSDDSRLSGMTLSAGRLIPDFNLDITSYEVVVDKEVTHIAISPTLIHPYATATANGSSVISGELSEPIPLTKGANSVAVEVTAHDGSTTASTISVYRLKPLEFTYTSEADIPLRLSGFRANGLIVDLRLGFPPSPGRSLTVIQNTGGGHIVGTFDNLKHGQQVELTHGGVVHRFVANYRAGSGNDLILQPIRQWPVAWGEDCAGKLGSGPAGSGLAGSVDQSGVLAGKTVVAFAAGTSHTLALCSDGTVAAWGDNGNGQLGNGTTISSGVPVLVLDTGALAGKTVVSVAAGGEHSLALCSDGSVMAWGLGTYGQLGNGSKGLRTEPVPIIQTGVLAGKTVVAVSAGKSHTLALTSDGTIAAWGSSAHGQVGNGGKADYSAPVLVMRAGVLVGKTVVAVTAGEDHSIAVSADGTVAAWGRGDSGQLGNGTISDSIVPSLVIHTGALSGKSVVAVATSQRHSFALCQDGSLVAWGSNDSGQLGDGTYTSANTPVSVMQSELMADKTAVAVVAGQASSIVMCADGFLVGWGSNGLGELGLGSMQTSNVPVALRHVRALGLTVAVAAGSNHYLALRPDGAITGWGDNCRGQLGNGLRASQDLPRNVMQSGALAGKTILGISSGYHHSLAVCSDGSVAAWGRGDAGQLGDGMNANSSIPVAVDRTGVLAGKTVVAVSAGGFHSMALCSDGTIALWGSNESGQLGNGAKVSSNRPVLASQAGILAGKTLTAVSAGEHHSVALCTEGRVAVWGSNLHGQLGQGTSGGDSSIPVWVPQSGALAGKGVTAISTRFIFSIALCSDGSVVSWGGKSEDMPTPLQSLMLSNVPVTVSSTGVLASRTVSSLASGHTHSLALCSDGRIAAWGLGRSGELGDGPIVFSREPVLVNREGVLADKDVIAVSAGSSHSFALCSDGSLAAWGDNSAGQFGNRTFDSSSVPVAVADENPSAGRHFTAIAAGGQASLGVAVFPASADSTLAGLELSNGNLIPSFSSDDFQYGANVSHAVEYIALISHLEHPYASVEINGITVPSGVLSPFLSLEIGTNIFTVAVRAEDGGSTSTHSISVTRTGPVPEFEEWLAGFGEALSDGTPEGDPDRDGIPNLFEYIINGNPLAPSLGNIPVALIAEDSLHFTFRRRAGSAADTTQVFQYSTDFEEWSDIVIDGNSDARVTLGAADPDGMQSVTVSLPRKGVARLFTRLHATQSK